MIKCKICGNEFKPTILNHYVSKDVGKVGLIAALQSNDEEKIYDTFDCPSCGCQVIAQERKRNFFNLELSQLEEKEENEDDEDDE